MFQEWLLLTEMTASQFLKRPENQDYVNRAKNHVSSFVSSHIHNNFNLIVRYTNWFLKELIRRNIPLDQVSPTLYNMWDNIGDFIVSQQNNNQMQGRFNTIEYTYDQAVADSDNWHMNMKANERKKGAAGRTVVDLSDLPGFQGWKWVALDRSTCGDEADAMGHCGNAGGKGNILSLRDPQDHPHLTFINHHGSLGEMKGKGNSKPSPRYHMPIVKLLLSNEVGAIRGEGYAPEQNFSLNDLSPELQQMVRERKPYIDRPDEFDAKKHKIIDGIKHKSRGLVLANSTPETVSTAVKDLVNRNYNIVPDRLYDMEITKDTTPEHIYNNRVWMMYTELLNSVYSRAKHTHPSNLFIWMDRMIEAFVSTLVELDQKSWDLRQASENDIIFFPYLSNIVKLDEMVYRLTHKQPAVLRGAPKRSRFQSWDQYIRALRDYLDSQGYDLPGYNPSNHMVSYEFNQKMGEEIVKQGQGIAELVNQAYQKMNPRLAAISLARHQFAKDNPDKFFYGKEPKSRKQQQYDDNDDEY